MKKTATIALLSLLCVGAVAGVSWYFQSEISADARFSVTSPSQTTIDLGIVHDDFNSVVQIITLENVNSNARFLEFEVLNPDANSLQCLVENDFNMTVTESSVPAASSKDYYVRAIVPSLPNGFSPNAAASCTIRVNPIA